MNVAVLANALHRAIRNLTIMCSLAASGAWAEDTSVMATQAVKAMYGYAVPDFEKASAQKVSVAWVGSSDISMRIKGGESVDVVLIARAGIDDLIAAGRLVPGSRVDFARSGVGVAVRAGAPKPAIDTVAALKQALTDARSIAISSGSSSVYLVGLFQRMGIYDDLKPKLKQIGTGLSVGEVIARGEAEIGFQQVSELLPVQGISFLGPLPNEIQNYTVYSGGIHVNARSMGRAQDLLRFLQGPASHDAIRKAGMELVPSR